MPTCQWHSPISTRVSFRPRSSPATSRVCETTANGTGPFKLASYEPDRRIVVERNPAYYIPARPYLDRIELLVYPDRTAETSAMISGEVDLLLTTAPGEYQRLANADGVKALRTPSGQFLNVNMGCDQKPFNDVARAKALSLCVDREALVGFVAGGSARRARTRR